MLTPDELRAAVEQTLDQAGRAWLDRALTEAADAKPRPDASGPARWELDFASAGRHIRPARISRSTEAQPTAPATTGQDAERGPKTQSAASAAAQAQEAAPDAVRVLLLHAAGADARTVARLYAHGTGAERRAVLRALPHLPLFTGPDAVPLVEDALRTNDTRLVAAAVGPYAARHLSPHSWRQALLKCLFTGVPLTAVADWERRARGDAELGRMLTDYAHERTAAGRPVPGDLDRVLALTRPSNHEEPSNHEGSLNHEKPLPREAPPSRRHPPNYEPSPSHEEPPSREPSPSREGPLPRALTREEP
ncbi:EboA domain-containing protein [Streptomyces sp. SRF1]|uniref:EboA domain-containing protein n=1 Tax=Streptomyces sp. SRF1 TaxID=1549642 RepID=UPI0025B22769|nr:EboA domain-containing protein [Streptomyces sp. SRF1]MDN3060132.1 EboA domain-containing protein [Streptomyces sp. SRF1]